MTKRENRKLERLQRVVKRGRVEDIGGKLLKGAWKLGK